MQSSAADTTDSSTAAQRALKLQDDGLSRSWDVKKFHSSVYTGGKVALTTAGDVMGCMCGDGVTLVDVKTGGVVRRLGPDPHGIGGNDDDDEGGADEDGHEAITSFALNPRKNEAVTASRNLLLRHWDLETGAMVRTWKAHDLPVVTMEYDPTGTFVATGSPDRTVRVFDVAKGYCTHCFRGHAGVVSTVRWHPRPGKLTVDDDCNVRAWDLNTSKCVGTLTKHLSVVTGIDVSRDGRLLVTAGRDKVIELWDAATFAPVKTVPVYEALEDVRVLPKDMVPGEPHPSAIYFATVGERGSLRVWRFQSTADDAIVQRSGGDSRSGGAGTSGITCRCVFTQRGHTASSGLAGVLPHASIGTILSVTNEQELVFQRLEQLQHYLSRSVSRSSGRPDASQAALDDGEEAWTLVRDKVLVGYNDEVIDVQYLPRLVEEEDEKDEEEDEEDEDEDEDEDEEDGGGKAKASSDSKKQCGLDGRRRVWDRAVVATNSDKLKIFNLSTFGVTLLEGHTDIILATDVSPDGTTIASVGKDHAARVWSVETNQCVALAEGHTEAVGAVAFSRRAQPFEVGRSRAARGKQGGQGRQGGAPGTVPLLFTGSKDRTLKKWDLGPMFASLAAAEARARKDPLDTTGCGDDGGRIASLTVSVAIRAHEKDINALSVAPNDQLVASASQDKTVKLWSTADLSLTHTLRGHKRGVWCVEFSPVDRCVVSGSGDRTLKVWSVADGSCLRTFEGHTASVLRVRYLKFGMQLMSAGADGLVKLWAVRSNECMNTFDGHRDKVWALAVRPDEVGGSRGTGGGAARDGAGAGHDGSKAGDGGKEDHSVLGEMITGGGDSLLNVWHDVTAEQAEFAVREREERVTKEQELSNLERACKYVPAIQLAIELDAPFRLHGIFERIVSPVPDDANVRRASVKAAAVSGSGGGGGDDDGGEDEEDEEKGTDMDALVEKARREADGILDTAVARLSLAQIAKCLEYAKTWNSNSRHSQVAQRVLRSILRHVSAESLATLPGISDTIDALEAYSDRHFQRLDRLSRKTYLLDFTLESMKTLLPPEEEEEEEEEEVLAPMQSSATRKRKPPMAAKTAGPAGRATGRAGKRKKGAGTAAEAAAVSILGRPGAEAVGAAAARGISRSGSKTAAVKRKGEDKGKRKRGK